MTWDQRSLHRGDVISGQDLTLQAINQTPEHQQGNGTTDTPQASTATPNHHVSPARTGEDSPSQTKTNDTPANKKHSREACAEKTESKEPRGRAETRRTARL